MQKGRAMMFKPCLLLGLACSMAAWAHAAEPAQPPAQATPELQWLRSLRPVLNRSQTVPPVAQPAANPADPLAVTPTPAPAMTASPAISAPSIHTTAATTATALTTTTTTTATATNTATAATTVNPVSSITAKPASAGQAQEWTILLSDKTLYRTLRRWTQEANLQLLWQVDRDYPIEAEVAFSSTLREAIGQVMAGVALTDYPLQAVFNSSTRVLRVIRHLDDQRR